MVLGSEILDKNVQKKVADYFERAENKRASVDIEVEKDALTQKQSDALVEFLKFRGDALEKGETAIPDKEKYTDGQNVYKELLENGQAVFGKVKTVTLEPKEGETEARTEKRVQFTVLENESTEKLFEKLIKTGDSVITKELQEKMEAIKAADRAEYNKIMAASLSEPQLAQTQVKDLSDVYGSVAEDIAENNWKVKATEKITEKSVNATNTTASLAKGATNLAAVAGGVYTVGSVAFGATTIAGGVGTIAAIAGGAVVATIAVKAAQTAVTTALEAKGERMSDKFKESAKEQNFDVIQKRFDSELKDTLKELKMASSMPKLKSTLNARTEDEKDIIASNEQSAKTQELLKDLKNDGQRYIAVMTQDKTMNNGGEKVQELADIQLELIANGVEKFSENEKVSKSFLGKALLDKANTDKMTDVQKEQFVRDAMAYANYEMNKDKDLFKITEELSKTIDLNDNNVQNAVIALTRTDNNEYRAEVRNSITQSNDLNDDSIKTRAKEDMVTKLRADESLDLTEKEAKVLTNLFFAKVEGFNKEGEKYKEKEKTAAELTADNIQQNKLETADSNINKAIELLKENVAGASTIDRKEAKEVIEELFNRSSKTNPSDLEKLNDAELKALKGMLGIKEQDGLTLSKEQREIAKNSELSEFTAAIKQTRGLGQAEAMKLAAAVKSVKDKGGVDKIDDNNPDKEFLTKLTNDVDREINRTKIAEEKTRNAIIQNVAKGMQYTAEITGAAKPSLAEAEESATKLYDKAMSGDKDSGSDLAKMEQYGKDAFAKEEQKASFQEKRIQEAELAAIRKGKATVER